jgi:methionyl-tRNA formyltransferase
MNILFFGTSEFAVPALRALIKASFPIVGVVTLPDRKQGRGLETLPSPIKKIALENNIPIFEPEKLSAPETLEELKTLDWDVGVVAAYGKLIPQSIIDFPKHGVLNIHPSILPELRGPSPLQYAILEGKKETGVTIMCIDKEMDHGPILAQTLAEIEPDDTAETLGSRLADIGANLLAAVLPVWVNGSLKAQEQDHSKATLSKMIEKEDGHIKWGEPVQVIERKIRAYQPWPGAFTFANKDGKKIRLKIIAASILSDSAGQAGLVAKNGSDMIVYGNGGALRIQTIQPEGKKSMLGEEFLRGYGALVGSTLE